MYELLAATRKYSQVGDEYTRVLLMQVQIEWGIAHQK